MPQGKYKSITVPPELYERMLKRATKTHRSMPQYLAYLQEKEEKGRF